MKENVAICSHHFYTLVFKLHILFPKLQQHIMELASYLPCMYCKCYKEQKLDINSLCLQCVSPACQESEWENTQVYKIIFQVIDSGLLPRFSMIMFVSAANRTGVHMNCSRPPFKSRLWYSSENSASVQLKYCQDHFFSVWLISAGLFFWQPRFTWTPILRLSLTVLCNNWKTYAFSYTVGIQQTCILNKSLKHMKG